MEQREEMGKELKPEKDGVKENVRADFYAIFQDVLKNIWVAVLVGISVAFLAYTASWAAYHPVYVSQTTFVVSARGGSTGAYANLSQTQRLAESFKTVLNSDVLKKKAAEQLGMDSFSGDVSVAIVRETNLLTVSVSAGTVVDAFGLVNALLDQYPSVTANVLGKVVLEIFEAPAYPAYPSVSFQGSAVMKKAFLAGTGAMIVLFALLSYFKDTVKNEKEVEAKLDTGLFASVPHERKYKNIKSMLRRKRKKLWVTEPSVGFGFSETMKKIRTKLIYQQRKTGAKVLAVSSAGPGEGKSTLAVNLALMFAQYPRKVLLIEGDLRESRLSSCLDISPEDVKSWGVCAAAKGDLESTVHYCKDHGFYVMVNNEKVPHSTDVLASGRVAGFIEKMKEEMDLIIIDAPHVKGRADADVWVRMADMCLMVVRQNRMLSKYINDSIDILEGHGHKLLGCVFNDAPGRISILNYGYGNGYGYGYGYGKYGKYGRYGRYGKYGKYYSRRHREEPEKE